MSEDWRDQDRPLGGTAFAGEAGMGALVAILLQTMVSVTLIAAAAVWNGGVTSGGIAGWLSAAACAQYMWMAPAFVVALFWRPGFAGGLALGAMFGTVLGFGLSCLAALAL